jgi:hypothetical protein
LQYLQEEIGTLVHIQAVIGFLILVALAVFFWRRYGIGSGRAFGNRLAAHNGIPKNTFYYLLENGVKGSSREFLASLEQSNLSLDQASVAIAPSLSRGIERLEARFGTQEMYDKAKPIVARLLAESEQKT